MTYAKKILYRSASVVGVVLLSILLAALSGVFFILSRPEKYGVVIIFLLGYFSYYFIKWAADSTEEILGPTLDQQARDFKSAKRGIDGEDTVYGWLKEFFPKESTLRNLTLPNRKFDIDFVVVSDKGVTIVEVKNFSDHVQFEDDEYFQQKDGRKILLSPDDDPRRAVRNHAYALSVYLDSVGIKDMRINKVLVFSNGHVSFSGETGVFIVKDKDALKKYFDSIDSNSHYSPETVEKIIGLLNKTK